jgi:hypothetical protein
VWQSHFRQEFRPPTRSPLTKSEPGDHPARKVLIKLGAKSVNEPYWRYCIGPVVDQSPKRTQRVPSTRISCNDGSYKTRIVRDPSASSERHEIVLADALKHEKYRGRFACIGD